MNVQCMMYFVQCLVCHFCKSAAAFFVIRQKSLLLGYFGTCEMEKKMAAGPLFFSSCFIHQPRLLYQLTASTWVTRCELAVSGIYVSVHDRDWSLHLREGESLVGLLIHSRNVIHLLYGHAFVFFF